MENSKKIEAKQNVLLNGDELNQAVDALTQGGKKKIDGLYLPGGQKVQQVQQPTGRKAPPSKNEEIRKNQNLARMAKKYTNDERVRGRKAARAAKTVQDMEDEDAARKAHAVLEGANNFERSQFEELFDFFDVDKDRTWGSIEFAQRMTDIGFATSVEDAANLLYFAGVKDVDRITYDDFLMLMPKLRAFRRLLEKDAMRAFAAKDVHCTGHLSLKQLREVIYAIAGPDGIDEKQVDYIIKKSDRERTGRIPYEFFIRAFFGTPPVLEYRARVRKRTWLYALCCGSAQPARGGGIFDDSDSDDDTRL